MKQCANVFSCFVLVQAVHPCFRSTYFFNVDIGIWKNKSIYIQVLSVLMIFI